MAYIIFKLLGVEAQKVSFCGNKILKYKKLEFWRNHFESLFESDVCALEGPK